MAEIFNAIQTIDTSYFVKKDHYNTKFDKIEEKIPINMLNDEYVTTNKFNKLTAENVPATLKQAKLATEFDFANFL